MLQLPHLHLVFKRVLYMYSVLRAVNQLTSLHHQDVVLWPQGHKGAAGRGFTLHLCTEHRLCLLMRSSSWQLVRIGAHNGSHGHAFAHVHLGGFACAQLHILAGIRVCNGLELPEHFLLKNVALQQSSRQTYCQLIRLSTLELRTLMLSGQQPAL